MKKLISILLLLSFMVIAISGCSSSSSSSASPEKISAKKAKEMMDEDKKIIVLDVRTKEEYNSGHIANAILVPDYEVKDKAKELLTDQSAKILVYCRSGRRSALAAQTLCELGYTSVYDFGGIIDWPYDIEK